MVLVSARVVEITTPNSILSRFGSAMVGLAKYLPPSSSKLALRVGVFRAR